MRKLFQSKADANGRYHGENGSYNARTNTIRLDVNAGANSAYELSRVTLLRTMSHELTHALQQNSPAQYDALKRAVLDVLTSKSGASIEEMAARMRDRDSSLNDDGAALDEVVAEARENMLRDSDAMEQLIAQHPAEAKTFLEKMKQFFTDIVNAIRAAFGGSGTSRSREATALMQQAEEYLDICEKWSKALQETAEISGRMDRQTGDGDVQYSLRDETYLAAVEDGDMQKAQAMVDEAARQAGYTRKLYHGTQYQFNQFMRGGEGIHLGTFEAADFVRRTTVKWENQGRMIEAYVRLDNPMYVPYDIQRWNVENLRDLIFAANGLQTSKELLATTADGQQIDLDFSQVEGIPQITKKAPRPARSVQVDEDFGTSRRKIRRGAAVQTETATTRETNRALSDEEQLSRMKTFDEIAEWLKARGIDGIEYINAIEDKNSTSVLVFDSNQVKLADPVTYDDQGDVIPLSERFDKGNEDIRYSIRTFDNGEKFVHVDTDQEIFSGLSGKELRTAAHNYLIQKFRGKVVGNVVRAYVSGVSGRKLLYPNKTPDMRIIEAVCKAVPELGNLLDASTFISSETDSESHSHGENVIGWHKYRTIFEVDGMFVRGITNIEITKNGDVYYGMSKLKDISDSPTVRAYVEKADRTDRNVSDTSIAPSDGSVKYSLRENDRKYMDAVEQGDTAEAQKLVDAAAKAAGYKNLFYHGAKKGGGFTTFRGWSYFTENKGYAQRYSESGNANSLYTTYVKMERPFDTRIPEVRELFDEARMEYGMGQLQDTGLPDWTDGYDLSEYIEENDLPYDGIVLDEGGDFVNGKPVSRGLSYVIRNSAQIKSADAVTYDDNGNVIPLSERFNSENDDIRYQMRDDDDGDQGLVGIFDEAPRLEEAHIDQRTWDNMSDRRVHSFMNDYPASRMWLARMASILQSDVTASTAGQRLMNEGGTFMGQKRDTTPLLAEMKDSGYTWQQMADVFGKMAEVFENGDLEGKVPETAIWKRAELILDRAVTEGYTDMNGIEYRPDAGYMRYKDALPGAKAREIPANAVEDTFEDVDNRLAGGGNAAAQTGGDGERVQLQGDTSYQEKQQSAKSGIALMDGGPSNRELLSSALESAAQTPEELRYVQSYKKQAQKIAEMEGLLAERRAEVQRLQDMKNRTADQEIRMKNLQTSIAETESMIDKRDKGLLKMEAMEPLRNVLDRERANYRETLKQAKKDAAARQREKDAAKLDNALLATQMHEGREWAAKLHDAENRVAEANQKVEDLKAQSLADRMHESSEWAAKLRKAENQLATAKRQLETAQMQRIAERMAEGRKWANEKLLETITISRSFGTPSGARTLDTLIKSQVLYQLS